MKKFILSLILFLISFSSFSQCFQQTSAGGSHSGFIKSDGTLWGTGRNDTGQIGVSPWVSNSNTLVQVGNENNWRAISSGSFHTCAIKTDNTLWTWGKNNVGQLGDGTFVQKTIPTQIGTDQNWSSVSSGYTYTMCVKTNGTLWAWGDNTYGQLGNNSILPLNSPTQIGTDTDWLSVSSGAFHTLATKTNGSLWAWGFNNSGQLGDGTSANQIVPIRIGTDSDWANVSAGLYHSIALKQNGTLWTWGKNDSGQLGDGTTSQRNSPTQIGTATWIAISRGDSHTVAIKSNNTLWSWGGNAAGQLGNGTTNPTLPIITALLSPVQIGTATDWQSVTSKVVHNLAIKTDGSLFVWGNNPYGQLGNGVYSPTPTTSPIAIACPTSVLGTSQSQYLEGFNLYPNPVGSILNINIENVIIEEISVVDVYGKIVLNQTKNLEQINVENLSKGIYILKVLANSKTFQSKFVKN
jgi:Secretion system C-terminal sorting domain/Regulator of chromosome condensation (RCC1) repeat